MVYAFEPDVDLGMNLLRSFRLRRNRDLRISLLSVAISDVDGTANFQISKFSRAMNKLAEAGKWHDHQIATKELRSVVTMRIDSSIESLRPPTAVKIDVEGAEMHVLRGGRETIIKYRPNILIESPHEIQTDIGEFFKGIDYVLFDGTCDCPRALELPVWDTIAVPRENSRFDLVGQATY